MGKLAALSSSLLARKGQARPAMRPQGFPGYTTPVEDLGWNDMGHDVDVTGPAFGAEMPPVLVERAALVAEIAPAGEVVAFVPPTVVEPEMAAPAPVNVAVAVKPVSVATATRIRRETSHKGKAAFTLRLDAERHLKLRLASAVADRSAQILMTQALDAFLETMPEVEALVAQLPAAKRR